MLPGNPSTLIELLHWRAFHQADRTAYTFLLNGEKEGPRLTYGELDRRARAIGALLQSYKANGERVLLLYPPGLEFITAFFGCLYAGAIAVPVYPPRKKRQLSRIPAIIEDAHAAFALTTENIHAKIQPWFTQTSDFPAFKILTSDTMTNEIADNWREPDIQSHDVAFLQYTSGSTAMPKGVMVSHANLLHNLVLIQKKFNHTPESVGVIWLPSYHDMGLIGGILQPLFVGFPVLLMSPAAFLQQPIRWLQAISRYRATTSGGPNFGYEFCVNRIPPEQWKTLDLSSWDLAFNGSEPVHHKTLDDFAAAFGPYGFRKEAFYPCYGLAETTLLVSGGQKAALPVIQTFHEKALEYDWVVEASEDNGKVRKLVSCGQTMPNHTIEIVHPELLTRCAPKQIGEIWVSGPSVTQGYWRRPEETKTTFRAYLKDLAKKPVLRGVKEPVLNEAEEPALSKGPFLRTGDLGFFKGDELFITGRLKDLIIIRGRNHYSEDIEREVEYSHPLFRKKGSAAFSANIAGEERLIIAAEIDRRYWDRRRRQAKKYSGVDRRSRPDPAQLKNPLFLDVEKAVSKIRQAVTEHRELQVYAVLLLNPGTIPKTTSGKIRRYACKAGFLKGNLEVRASSIMKNVDTVESEGFLDWESLLANPPEKQLLLLEKYLQNLIAKVLKIDPAEIDRQKHLSSLGIDSLMAVELQHRLETSPGIAVPITRFLRGTSVADLAAEGLQQLRSASSSSEASLVFIQDQEQFPLSYNQQAIWFLHQLAPESTAYNILFALRIRSELDVLALRRAFQSLMPRHPVLRTTYIAIDGKPFQQVHKDQKICFEEIDASTWNQGDIDRHLAEDAQYHFDLEKGPVLRVTLLTRSPKDHVLLLTIHHVATDFWSMLLLIDELGLLYQAEESGARMALPLLGLSYKDYVSWQEKMLADSKGERLFAYWREQLSGELPVLNLPTDRPRPPVQTYQGATHAFTLSKTLTDGLRALAQASEATLYMTLLAAFQVLLYRYTGQEDILVGSPVAGRSRPDFGGILGYFVNPVVLRADLSGDPHFQAFLEQVCQTVLAALEHQDYPFQLLVERLKLKRDASRSPIFQVMFTLQQPHRLESAAPFVLREAGGQMNLAGLALESLAVEGRVAQFDLTLMMVEKDGELLASLEYNTDLFDAATIARMEGHFQTLLEGIVAFPAQHVSKLPILTEAERSQILVEWNDTKVEYPSGVCIHELFEVQAAQTPDAIAVVFPPTALRQGSGRSEDQQLTYQELNARANQLAHYLRTMEVGPEVLVGICVERSLEMIVGLLGILKAGGAYVPLDPSYPKNRLAFMMEDSQAPVLLTQQKLVNELPEQAAKVICLDSDWDPISQGRKDNPVSGVTADNLIYVIYTSGSTGKPKGAMNIHRALCNRLLWMQDAYQLTGEDRILQKTPFSFDVSGWEFFWPLLTGARLVMAKPEGQKDSAYLVSLIAEQEITTMHFVPPMLQVFLEEPGVEQCSSLRRVICSGEALPFELQERFFERLRAELHNLYGPTEAAIDVTFWQCERESKLRTVPIGRPIANTQIYILSPNFQPVPIGVPGELYIGGVNLARGYLNRPELTREKFIPNPLSDESGDCPESGRRDRLYKSGDLTRFLPDGNIEFLNRIDHQVKIRGFRVELGEIEAVLTGYSAVREAVLIVREDHPGDKRLVAYVVQNSKSEIRNLKSDLRSFLKEKLPDYMVPAAFVILEKLPLTPNGKIDRRALPMPEVSRSDQEGGYAVPRNQTEEVLTGIWADVLKLERVGIHDNFFELGGDSIISIRIIARAKQAGLQFSPRDLLQYQTIAELAAVTDTIPVAQAEQRPVTGSVPLTPVQQWFFEQNFAESYHWNQAVLLELYQPPEPTLLKETLRHLIAHHDALRLRFFLTGSSWEQKYTGLNEDVPFSQIDLSQLPEAKHEQAMTASAAELQASLNLTEGPLIRVALFDLGPEKPQRLLLVIHHLVVDGVSWRILLEDLQTAYLQLSRKEEIVLAAKTTSFKQWAEHIQDYAQSGTVAAEVEYWLSRLAKVSEPSQAFTATVASTEQVLVSLSADQTRSLLQEVPQVYHTRIDDVLLTALVQSFTRWTGRQTLLIDLEGHGREAFSEDVDVSRTVGWFTAIFPVLLELGTQHPGEALKSIKEQLRHVPNRGIGYGLLRYLSRDETTRRKFQAFPRAEIIFNYLGQLDQVLSESPLSRPVLSLSRESEKELAGPLRSLRGHRSHPLEVNGFVAEGELQVVWTYSKNIHKRGTIEQLAQDFMQSLQTLIAHCLSPEAGGYTPSDFPAAKLDQKQLDKILSKAKLAKV